jgi:hypothetical protein
MNSIEICQDTLFHPLLSGKPKRQLVDPNASLTPSDLNPKSKRKTEEDTSKKADVEMEEVDAVPHPPPKPAYIAFFTEEMEKRKQKDNDVEFEKLSAEIAAVWKSLNPEQKKVYS